MKERDMQTMFGKYLRENPPAESEVYELKICKTLSMRWDRVADHQLQALLDVSQDGHYWKIPDMTAMNNFASPKPFDCQYLKYVNAYIVIWFYKPRQAKVFHKIHINDWMKLPRPRKSFREEDIKHVSEKIYLVK